MPEDLDYLRAAIAEARAAEFAVKVQSAMQPGFICRAAGSTPAHRRSALQ